MSIFAVRGTLAVPLSAADPPTAELILARLHRILREGHGRTALRRHVHALLFGPAESTRWHRSPLYLVRAGEIAVVLDGSIARFTYRLDVTAGTLIAVGMLTVLIGGGLHAASAGRIPTVFCALIGAGTAAAPIARLRREPRLVIPDLLCQVCLPAGDAPPSDQLHLPTPPRTPAAQTASPPRRRR